MTPYSVTIVNFDEIPVVEIVCKCGSRISLPLPNHNLPHYVQCVGCNAQLWESEQDQNFIRTVGVLRSLSNWKDLPNKKFSLEFSLKQSTSQT